jgi:dienelactone hydrolase
MPLGEEDQPGGDYCEWWVADHLLVVDAAERRFGRSPIGYLGLSMGAVLGVHLVAAEPRIAAAVFAAGASGESARDGTATGPAVGWLSGANPEEAASRLGGRPVLMVQADEDEVFSREAAFALYGAFRGRKEISFFPGTHSVWRHPGQWNRRMLAFFHETLRM